ncbi:leucine-rich repeat and IQ domain-containing protein 3 isoform X2 [Erinaceus europaeus]|uniref:Leucine-rich repeat and IQ domain-containing protein 3 isoform X2 n=1 Tax=Erinaceus europaeus TaxID=9365 RepID=A0ABM3YAR4_ERIEU|nr:leucine-rich repeat and IQ domain-containing protein 3 isoform X2 [Erinaceus europaeus]
MFHGTITKELTNHEEWRHYNENIIEDQKDFVFVKYTSLHLKTMECLQSCISLKVCIFSNNFITDIHPLQNCIKLVKLDLHGNQIKSLPNTTFWSGLKNLKLLYLHDNGFSKLKNVCMLSACPNLIALTMFDCPVSLKKGYRHVIVNSIWPLKALDYYVVSDEEIIQNCVLPERFKTCNHRLFFNFCSSLKKGSNYEDEINNIKYIMSTINEILAHNSPVLIVQRWIRGFLVRKSLSHFLLYKRQQEKFMNEYKSRWIYICKSYEDKLFKDLFIHSETNIRGKLARWKYNIHYPFDLSCSFKQRRHIPSILYELHPKDTDIKLKHSKYLIQKGQKDFEGDTDDEELATSFRISVSKLPLYTLDVVKKKEQCFFPVGAYQFSNIFQKPMIKRKDFLLKNNMKRDFLMIHRTGMNLEAVYNIDKHYSELKKEEIHKNKIAAVKAARTAEERVASTVQETSNNKIYAAQKQARKDNKAIQSGLQQHWREKFTYLEEVRERRALFLKEKSQKAANRLLIQTISNERDLLIKGVININRLKNNLDALNEKSRIVQQQRETEKYQRELNQQMKKIRAQEIYKRHCEEKFVTNMIAFQQDCERFQDAKKRVAIVKRKFYF